MAKTMLAISLLVGAGACSSPAPTAHRSGPAAPPPVAGPEPTTTEPTTTTEPATTSTSEVPETVETATTALPTTRARSAPTTVPYERPSRSAPPEYIKQCESGGDYTAVNPVSGAGGAWQFLPSTWRSVGGTGLPQNATPAEQDFRATLLWDGGAGAGHWVCA